MALSRCPRCEAAVDDGRTAPSHVQRVLTYLSGRDSVSAWQVQKDLGLDFAAARDAIAFLAEHGVLGSSMKGMPRPVLIRALPTAEVRCPACRLGFEKPGKPPGPKPGVRAVRSGRAGAADHPPPRVGRRFRREAEQAIPEPRLTSWMRIGRYVIAVCATLAFFSTKAEAERIDPSWGASAWLYLAWWGLAFPVALILLTALVDSPGRRRRIAIEERVASAQAERLQAQHEQRRFYSSAEWRRLRSEVIEAEEPACRSCGAYILDTTDVTVDHTQPRSRFPELALVRENLQILCRSCNSAKGNR